MNNLRKYLIGLLAFAAACNPFQVDELIDPNNPNVSSVASNASPRQIQFLFTGLESRHRGYVTNVSQAWNTFGREIWYLNGSDPRFQTDWLGQAGRLPDAAYFGFGPTGGGSFAVPYQAIKQAHVLMDAAENTPFITEQEKKAVSGFAKTIMAYQYMIPANWLYQNGIRIDVKDPYNPGPFVSYDDALTYINQLLTEGYDDLNNAGTTLTFSLSRDWSGIDAEDGIFNSLDGLKKINRAIAARLAIYREDWQGALDALALSFMDLDGDLQTGPAHSYGGPPNIFNPLYYIPDAPVNTIIVVHPSMIDDATPGDLRVENKFFERANPVTITTDAAPLVGTHQDNRWADNTAPIAFIRNEELILIKAEAHAQLDQTALAVEAIDVIREAADIGVYTGGTTKAELIDEILYQRRYSLWAEPWGHRWIDARRYDKLDEIPTSYDLGTIFTQFPVPQAELNWDDYVGN